MARLDVSNGTLDVTSTQGKTWVVTFTLRDSAGALVNLNGYTAAWTMKDTYGGTTVASGTSSTYLTMGGAAGTIALSVPASVTAGIASGPYVHELEWTSGSGVKTGISGDWLVEPEVVT